MYADQDFYPDIISADAMKMLHATVHDLVEETDCCQQGRNADRVARVVFGLYCRGLTEPGKLRDLAALMVDHETNSLGRPGHIRRS